jgi:hypothetical protein
VVPVVFTAFVANRKDRPLRFTRPVQSRKQALRCNTDRRMTPQADLLSIIASATAPRGLRPRQDLREPNWLFWELRNLNIHRVAGLFDERTQFAGACDLEAKIRGVVSRRFKRSWWRGMAYGVVAVVGAVSRSSDDLKILVDVRENQSGTLQWVILTSSDTRLPWVSTPGSNESRLP